MKEGGVADAMAASKTRGIGASTIAIHEDRKPTQEQFDDDSDDELDESRGPLEDSGGTRLEDSEDDDDDDDDDEDNMDDGVAEDMRRFEQTFKGITSRFRLINRIGEGTFSTVYKAEDLEYDRYNNDWDFEKENMNLSPSGKKYRQRYRKTHFVAIKKIYVTSSPMRILNELDLLHDLRHCKSICPLITAFRHQDQVIAVLPYFRHLDFRVYFREMTTADMRPYFRSLFTALAAVHDHKILHRDIKPTNFLYDTRTKQGVLVDFGLAERQDADDTQQKCMCTLDEAVRNRRYQNSFYKTHPPLGGCPDGDKRPALRANRAGTRGFRAPEVLFKCMSQTPAIDIWAAGVVLLTILAQRFPFFNSADDIDAVLELATVFGRERMRAAARLHGQVFETNIPTISEGGHSLEKIVLWSTDRVRRGPDGARLRLPSDELDAVRFLEACLTLDPTKRITARGALDHQFLAREDLGSEDEMDVLAA